MYIHCQYNLFHFLFDHSCLSLSFIIVLSLTMKLWTRWTALPSPPTQCQSRHSSPYFSLSVILWHLHSFSLLSLWMCVHVQASGTCTDTGLPVPEHLSLCLPTRQVVFWVFSSFFWVVVVLNPVPLSRCDIVKFFPVWPVCRLPCM